MPTYEYRCVRGHSFDVFQKMSDEPVATCPECGEAAARVVTGGAGFLFKGEGFYITDYRSQEYKKKAEADQRHSPGSGGEKAAKTPEPSKKAESPSPAASGESAKAEPKRRSSKGGGSSGSGGSSASGTDG